MLAMQYYELQLIIANHQNLFFVSEKELSHAENAIWYPLNAHASVHFTALKNFLEEMKWQIHIYFLGQS